MDKTEEDAYRKSYSHVSTEAGQLHVEEFLRVLYRDGLLSQEEFQSRLAQLARLRAGELKPVLHAS